MSSSEIELYLYMGSTKPIIEWLKSEGVETRSQAIDKLRPYIGSLTVDSFMNGGCLAGAANGSDKILKSFPYDENTTCK